MIILSDCFTEKADEGCLNVANSLAKRMKRADPATRLISYKRESGLADARMELNSLFLSRELASAVRGNPVLYIPFSSNTTGSLLRTWVLSRMTGETVCVLFALRYPMNTPAKWLLRSSGAQVIALSEESRRFYEAVAGNRARYLKTGVDTGRFVPVEPAEKQRLRDRYGIPRNRRVVLHVGHLKSGRNVHKLADIDRDCFVLLAVSTESRQEPELRRALESRPHTRIIDEYVPDIQELYQLADAYLFPVEEEENCIDVPLSALEAAACGLPVVTTGYGELKGFSGRRGFFFLESTEPQEINRRLREAWAQPSGARDAVLDYDWDASIEKLAAIMARRESVEEK